MPRQQILRKGHLRSAIPLGLVTRAARRQLVEAVPHHLEVGPDLRVIQPNEEIAGFDAVARADVQLLDDADRRVLHLFDTRIDDDLPRRNDSAGEFRGRGPAADAADQQNGNADARRDMKPDRALCSAHAHDATLSLATGATEATEATGRTATGAAAAAGVGTACTRRNSFDRTSSRGPSACGRPSPMTSTRSTALSAAAR